MIDIVAVADAVFQMHIVVNGSKDIFLCNMLRNQFMNTLSERFRKCLRIIVVLILQKDLSERGIINEFCNAQFLGIAVHIVCNVDHKIAENLDISLLGAYPDIRNRGILDLISHLSGDFFSCCSENVAVRLVNNVLCEDHALDTVSESKLLIELVSADLRQIISAGIEEHRVDQAVRALHGKRLAGADLLVQFKKAALIVIGDVLDKACADLGLIAEHIEDLFIRADSERSDEDRHRDFPCAIHSYIKYIVGVCLILQPCAPVGDDCAGE